MVPFFFEHLSFFPIDSYFFHAVPHLIVTFHQLVQSPMYRAGSGTSPCHEVIPMDCRDVNNDSINEKSLIAGHLCIQSHWQHNDHVTKSGQWF